MRLDIANKKQRAVIKSEQSSSLSGDSQALEIDLTSDTPTERMILRHRALKVEWKVVRSPANGFCKSKR